VERAKGDIEILKAYETSTNTLQTLLSDPALKRENVEGTLPESMREANEEFKEIDDIILRLTLMRRWTMTSMRRSWQVEESRGGGWGSTGQRDSVRVKEKAGVPNTEQFRPDPEPPRVRSLRMPRRSLRTRDSLHEEAFVCLCGIDILGVNASECIDYSRISAQLTHFEYTLIVIHTGQIDTESTTSAFVYQVARIGRWIRLLPTRHNVCTETQSIPVEGSHDADSSGTY